jgi:teichuronic acid biosynthesis glycosyltransferase TuaC
LRALDELQRRFSADAVLADGVASGRANDSHAPQPPHVLTLTPFYPSDGDEVRGCFVAEALRQLDLCGVTSSVIAVDTVYHARKQSSPASPADWVRYPQLPGNFGLSSAGGFLGAFLSSRVRKLHRKSPIDVIHAHAALPCGHAAAFLSNHLGIPFVVTVHGLDVFNSCFEHGIAAGWRRKASLRVYKSASKVICISKKVQGLLADQAGSTVASTVVYNGTDPELFSPASPAPSLPAPGSASEQPPSILMVGNLLLGKGHELVLRAMDRLKGEFPDLQCRIIGEGADRVRFANLARDLGIGSQVHFLGRRGRAEVAAAMRGCNVFVLPSRYEGLGCVYLEAMACGKPVIGCWGQGIDEIVKHGVNGWLIPMDGIEELVQGLQVLLGDGERRRQIGEVARQTIVGNLTLSHQAQRLVGVYTEAAR